MLDSYHPHDIPTHLSHPLVDEARDSLMRAVAYLEPAERADVLRACHFGDVAHIKDKRKSGEHISRIRLRWRRFWQDFA